MNFLPREKFCIVTLLSADDALNKLRHEVVPRYGQISGFKASDTKKHFIGMVGLDEFSIQENITGRTSQIPLIKGKVWETGGVTHVAVTMTLQVPLFIFMCVWFGIFTIITIWIITESASGNLWKILPVPLGFMASVYLLVMGMFIPDSIVHKNRLAKIFEGSIYESK